MSYLSSCLFGYFTGVCVMGQAGFLPGTVVNCYGNDDTCTGSSTPRTESGQLFKNPCCFTLSDPFDPFSITAVNPGYYTVGSDGVCQSCTGKFCIDDYLYISHLNI